jgi:uncharacterized membrane protein
MVTKSTASVLDPHFAAPAARPVKSASSWAHRCPVLLLAAGGLAIAGYLAACQAGLVASAWDPFFGRGSDQVLHSTFSRALPVPDALLGALAYACEMVAVTTGGTDRYRTHPWIVLSYGMISLLLALTGIGLAATQIFILHAGCTICLCSTGLSLAIVWLASDEVIAAWKHRRQRNVTL